MSVEATVEPRAGLIPDGTAVVAIEKVKSDVERRQRRSPNAAPVATGVMSGGKVTLAGLEAKTPYHLFPVVDEVHSVKVDATAGQFKLTFEGQQTGNIAFNATAAAVREALEALSNIAVGDVEVTGGPGNSGGTTPYVVKFLKAFAGKDVAVMTGANGGTPLSGGGAAITISTTTGGSQLPPSNAAVCAFTAPAS